MSVRLGVNGFGRIGRSFLRALLARGGWYDNEWGYSHRLVDLAAFVAR